MGKNKTSISWFTEVGKKDIGLTGSKGEDLAEVTAAGIPVHEYRLEGES